MTDRPASPDIKTALLNLLHALELDVETNEPIKPQMRAAWGALADDGARLEAEERALLTEILEHEPAAERKGRFFRVPIGRSAGKAVTKIVYGQGYDAPAAIDTGIIETAVKVGGYWGPGTSYMLDGVAYADVREAECAWMLKVRAAERRPVAWMRGVHQPSSPNGPAEYDEEVCPGDDRPAGDGWFPLFKE